MSDRTAPVLIRTDLQDLLGRLTDDHFIVERVALSYCKEMVITKQFPVTEQELEMLGYSTNDEFVIQVFGKNTARNRGVNLYYVKQDMLAVSLIHKRED